MAKDSETLIDYTPKLRELMNQAQVNSFRELCERSGVPRSQRLKMRRGQFTRIPWESFMALAKSLEISVEEILNLFGLVSITSKPKSTNSQASAIVTDDSKNQWQQEGLEILESLMLQLPTASFAAQNNPTAPAVRLLPLLKPLDQLLESWDVERIGMVGEQTSFDPQSHQWMGPGEVPAEGSLVKFRYVGYRHGDRLLHRAKVGPIG